MKNSQKEHYKELSSQSFWHIVGMGITTDGVEYDILIHKETRKIYILLFSSSSSLKRITYSCEKQ